MSTRRSQWVEIVDTRSDGEEVLFPFRIRAEVRGSRVRARCYSKAGDSWELHQTWPWQAHGRGPNVTLEDLNRLAINVTDTFRQWLLVNERAEYVTLLECAEVVTGWEEDPRYVDGDSLVPPNARNVHPQPNDTYGEP
jgi:hypothetical protein